MLDKLQSRKKNYILKTLLYPCRQQGWRPVAKDKVKYRMRGDMFVTNQMWITFLSYCHFNVFQLTLKMSFSKIDVWSPGYTIFRRILVPNILIERLASRICLARLQGSLILIWVGFLGVRFEVGGKITPCLKLVRVMLETWNLARKYTLTCSFRKYIF